MRAADEALLTVRGLIAGYGRVEVLHGISLTSAAGQIVAIIGPNGAGKTTLMHAIAGLLPRRGDIRYLGAPAGTTEAMAAAGAVLVPETRALFADMSVQDNVLLGFYPRHRNGERGSAAILEEAFATFAQLKERRRQLAATLSGGERQMLALGRALMSRPRLLLLDEPSLGLAPRIVRDIFQVLAGLRELGLAVLLVEQNARAALQISGYGYVLELGEVVAQGRPPTSPGTSEWWRPISAGALVPTGWHAQRLDLPVETPAAARGDSGARTILGVGLRSPARTSPLPRAARSFNRQALLPLRAPRDFALRTLGASWLFTIPATLG